MNKEWIDIWGYPDGELSNRPQNNISGMNPAGTSTTIFNLSILQYAWNVKSRKSIWQRKKTSVAMASLFTRLQWSFRTIFTYMIIYSLSRSACPLLITFAGLSHSSRHASQRASFCGQLAMSRFKQKGVSIQCFRLESLLPKPQTSFTFWAIRLTWLSGHKSVDAQFQYKSLFKYNTPNPLQTWREFQRTDTDSPKPLASQPTASKKFSCQRFPSFPQHLVGFFGSQMVNGMSMVCQWYVLAVKPCKTPTSPTGQPSSLFCRQFNHSFG